MNNKIILLLLVCLTNCAFAQQSRLSDFATSTSGIDWIKIKPGIEIKPLDFFTEYQSNLGFDNNYSFELFQRYDDYIGFEHFKYNQHYKGIRVEGGQYILHSINNAVVKANGKLVENLSCSPIPVIDSKEAIAYCMSHVNAPKYYWQDPAKEELIKKIKNNDEATFYPQPELVIADEDYRRDGANYKLCWKVEIFAEGPIENEILFVDAHSGNILFSQDGCVSGSATAVTRYSGAQTISSSLDSATFVLLDSTRGGGVFTFDMNESTDLADAVNFEDNDDFWDNANAEADDAATDAHWGMEMTYDYFFQKHNRFSFDDSNSAIISYIHHDKNWFNAQWFGRMYARFGDGTGNPLTSIDVAAHELTHGVTQQTSDLVYRNEPGALNESFSDIFGSAVKNFALNDTGGWVIGAADFVLRNIQNPKLFSDPDTYHGQYWNFTGSDNGGVHTNSGVQNYWYYLLSVGDTGTNDNGDFYDVTGLGRDAAEAIAYRNTYAYLTVNSNYLDARQGAIESASDIYGTCSFEVQQTNHAWYAVGVGPDTLTNDIEILEVFYPEVSCDLSSAEVLGLSFRFNESGCGTTIPVGDTIKLSYTLNGATPVTESLVLTNALVAGDTINYLFATVADLSVETTHTLDFSVDYFSDLLKENDRIDNIEITKPFTLGLTDFLSFEKRIQVRDSFYVKEGSNGEVLVQLRAAEPSSNWGLQLGARDFDDPLITFPINEPDNFVLNPEYGCSACFCVDATGWSNVRMVFDLKQTFSLYYDSILGLGNIPEFVSSARLMVNGTQIGDQFHPTANDTDQFVNYVINLDAYAGASFEACIEGKHFIRWQEETIGGSTGDHTFIDNLYFTDMNIVGVTELEESNFTLFPNPGSGVFQIHINGDVHSPVTLEVLDLTGRILINEKLNGVGEFIELDLSEYSSGIYFVSMITENGKGTRKLILE